MSRNSDYPGGFISTTVDVSSVSDCSRLCEDTPGCVAFVLSPVAKSCTLKDDSHSDISYETRMAVRGGVAGLVNCRRRKGGLENEEDIDGFDRKQSISLFKHLRLVRRTPPSAILPF